MKLFPWRIGPARPNPSLRDSCGVSSVMIISLIQSSIASHFLLDDIRDPGG
jgi:hypothetical protein